MSESAPLFDAVLHKPRARWPWAVGALGALGVAAVVVLAARTGGTYRVMTPKGFQVLRRGMQPSEVQAIVGSGPILQTVDADGALCLTYGRPTLQRATFTVYEACYRAGSLLHVKEKELSAQAIDPELLKKSIEP